MQGLPLELMIKNPEWSAFDTNMPKGEISAALNTIFWMLGAFLRMSKELSLFSGIPFLKFQTTVIPQ